MLQVRSSNFNSYIRQRTLQKWNTRCVLRVEIINSQRAPLSLLWIDLWQQSHAPQQVICPVIEIIANIIGCDVQQTRQVFSSYDRSRRVLPCACERMSWTDAQRSHAPFTAGIDFVHIRPPDAARNISTLQSLNIDKSCRTTISSHCRSDRCFFGARAPRNFSANLPPAATSSRRANITTTASGSGKRGRAGSQQRRQQRGANVSRRWNYSKDRLVSAAALGRSHGPLNCTPPDWLTDHATDRRTDQSTGRSRGNTNSPDLGNALAPIAAD